MTARGPQSFLFCPVTFSGALEGTILFMQVDLSLSPVRIFISSLGMEQNNSSRVLPCSLEKLGHNLKVDVRKNPSLRKGVFPGVLRFD